MRWGNAIPWKLQKLYKKAAKIRKIGYDEFRREGDELDLYLRALDVIRAREPELAY